MPTLAPPIASAMVGDDALELILGSAALVTASLGFAVVRSWRRRRFFAYGLLSSLGIFAVTGWGWRCCSQAR